ncbi:hypothetical protein FOA43_004553 [Brettanomyces nanus]|uniref:Uncharacterized protein n=1 Tax=Eeniella nana TaxID=13502 RepID=A0A875S895_EENNA|nr:uncharacterized protein FOA43_004553 [Brettanomyces nanus]QPG77148.1 hypothetical protein FOA43_004553 [Brettanomyces nanus]
MSKLDVVTRILYSVDPNAEDFTERLMKSKEWHPNPDQPRHRTGLWLPDKGLRYQDIPEEFLENWNGLQYPRETCDYFLEHIDVVDLAEFKEDDVRNDCTVRAGFVLALLMKEVLGNRADNGREIVNSEAEELDILDDTAEFVKSDLAELFLHKFASIMMEGDTSAARVMMWSQFESRTCAFTDSCLSQLDSLMYSYPVSRNLVEIYKKRRRLVKIKHVCSKGVDAALDCIQDIGRMSSQSDRFIKHLRTGEDLEGEEFASFGKECEAELIKYKAKVTQQLKGKIRTFQLDPKNHPPCEFIRKWDGLSWPQNLVDYFASINSSRGNEDNSTTSLQYWLKQFTSDPELPLDPDPVIEKVDDLLRYEIELSDIFDLKVRKLIRDHWVSSRLYDFMVELSKRLVKEGYPDSKKQIQSSCLNMLLKVKQGSMENKKIIVTLKETFEMILEECKENYNEWLQSFNTSSPGEIHYILDKYQPQKLNERFKNKLDDLSDDDIPDGIEKDIPTDVLYEWKDEESIVAVNDFMDKYRDFFVDAPSPFIGVTSDNFFLKRFEGLSLGGNVTNISEYFDQIDRRVKRIREENEGSDIPENLVTLALFNKLSGCYAHWRGEYASDLNEKKHYKVQPENYFSGIEEYKRRIRDFAAMKFYQGLYDNGLTANIEVQSRRKKRHTKRTKPSPN